MDNLLDVHFGLFPLSARPGNALGFVCVTLFSLDNKDLNYIQKITNPPDNPSINTQRRKQRLEPRPDYEPFAIRNILTLVDSGNHFGDAISDRLAHALKIESHTD